MATNELKEQTGRKDAKYGKRLGGGKMLPLISTFQGYNVVFIYILMHLHLERRHLY